MNCPRRSILCTLSFTIWCLSRRSKWCKCQLLQPRRRCFQLLPFSKFKWHMQVRMWSNIYTKESINLLEYMIHFSCTWCRTQSKGFHWGSLHQSVGPGYMRDCTDNTGNQTDCSYEWIEHHTKCSSSNSSLTGAQLSGSSMHLLVCHPSSLSLVIWLSFLRWKSLPIRIYCPKQVDQSQSCTVWTRASSVFTCCTDQSAPSKYSYPVVIMTNMTKSDNGHIIVRLSYTEHKYLSLAFEKLPFLRQYT